jgi:fluoride exporter
VSGETPPDGWDDLPVDPDIEVAALTRRAPRPDPRVLVAISFGGMIGATLRYKLATLIHVPAGGFPWATFWTNVSGSFVLGFLLVMLIERFPPTRYARAFAGTGVLGAYTTFSTFSVETDVLVKDGHTGVAVAYVVASLVVGLAAVWAGVWLSRRVVPSRVTS